MYHTRQPYMVNTRYGNSNEYALYIVLIHSRRVLPILSSLLPVLARQLKVHTLSTTVSLTVSTHFRHTFDLVCSVSPRS